MATYFVISDIHSFYNEMIDALNKAGYNKENKNHVLINCGDLLDRGPDAVKCLQFINSIPESNRVLIRGNHEYLIEDCLSRGYFQSHDYHNMTNDTIHQISNIEDEYKAIENCRENFLLQNYLQSCIDCFETKSHIFVHGWIPCRHDTKWEFDVEWFNGNWYDASWICCFDAWANGIMVHDKTIVAGHWHTSYGHSKYHNKGTEWDDEWAIIWEKFYPAPKIRTACFDIFKDVGIIGLDACTVYSGKVNVLKIGKQKPLTNLIIHDNQMEIEM